MVRRKIVSESSFDLVVIRRAKFFNSSQLSLCIEEEFRMEFVGEGQRIKARELLSPSLY